MMQKSKPFLRWAGGKTWLIKHLPEIIGDHEYNNYHEPFLGGASIFLHLEPKSSFLSDLNPDLINTYRQIQGNVEEVIYELKKFKNTKEDYYNIRQSKYRSKVKKAARFIYLNQTSFNGIYRVNLKGEYNVPYGYRTKKVLDSENLISVSKSLSKCEIFRSDYRETIKNIKRGDLVFLDPPYTVAHNDNGFIKYNSKLFDLKNQYELSQYIDEIKNIEAYYILTNAAHNKIREIFTKPNDSIIELSRASLIGGYKAKRGRYKELIFTNIPLNG